MAVCLINKSGGGITSDDVTASKAQVLQGYRTITSDSDDEIIEGTIPVRGYHGPDSSEMWLYPQEGGYVVRIEEGYYHKGGQWKPYVIVPTSLAKSAVNYHPESTLSDTTTCGETGRIKMVDTKLNNYTNNQARNIGIDSGRGKLWMELGHGNAYYYKDDNVPHVETDASKFGTAGADSVLQWQTATSQHGINFQGTIPRWICNTGDVISAVDNNGFAWDDSTGANRGRGIVTKIPNGHFIHGANYVFLASPNLQPWNIRQNVNVNGVVGTMVDYGAGGQAFRDATFDGRLLTGVANKGFILDGIDRYLNLKNINYGYQGIVDGGLKFINGFGENTRFKSAPYIGCVFANSVNLTPFRFIKFGFKFLTFRGDGTVTQPASIELEVGQHLLVGQAEKLITTRVTH